jgi:CBS domain-containing protein
LDSVCWLAMGSEGREEQTIATDQDNGLILRHEDQQPAALLFARAVNEALDQCGFPLCKGNIMASNSQWCKTLAQWKEQFAAWADHSEPTALLNASIFFDFRGLAGDISLASELRESVQEHRSKTRFIRLMTENALRNTPPAAWTGGVLEQWLGSSEAAIDLKLQGSGIFVDSARALALKAGISETGTAARLVALANAGLLPHSEVEAWVDAFEFIQGVRLSLQHGGAQKSDQSLNPNLLDPTTLSELDKRILKETFRQLRKLQQRLQLDAA